ncbi:hypothetical protein CIK05_08910 [Bdellovibrio sp. qaytius]|nr:hypothetical protein CIK05_08910 [Bdellovibrio sp. qaytius]
MKKKLIMAAIMTAAATAGATPTPYPLDPSLLFAVTNSTTSGLIADDTDSRKVYVLPPTVAEASVNGLHTLSANIGFCKEMGMLQSYSRNTAAQISELSNQQVANKKNLDKIQQQLEEARIEAAEIVADKRLQALVDLDTRIESMEARLSELYALEEKCDKFCDQVLTEIKDTEVEKKKFVKDRRALALENAEAVKAYQKKKDVADALQTNFNDANSTFIKQRAELLAIRSEFNEMYKTFAKMEGGRAALNYESNWDSNLDKLRNENPAFQFEKIQTNNAKLFTSINSVSDIPTDLAVVGYEIAGIQKENYLELPAGFPGAISGNIRLSLVGACPMIHPEYFDIEKGYGADKMAYGLTFTYDFPAAYHLKATAKYNMYKLYTKTVSSGSSGGFFSSHSWTNVEERTFFRDGFSVDWISQDPQNDISDDRRMETEREMRQHIMERIGSLALPTSPNQGQMVAPGAPPQRGATVVAGSLMQACPGNAYCAAGSLILYSLDAIFGSSSASASYLQSQNFEATETWTQSKVIMKPWVTTFIPHNKNKK